MKGQGGRVVVVETRAGDEGDFQRCLRETNLLGKVGCDEGGGLRTLKIHDHCPWWFVRVSLSTYNNPS